MIVGKHGRKRGAPRVADRIAHQLALELLDGQVEPGWRLPSEKQLTQDLGCSRQALRGALRLLEAWGLVTIKMGRDGGAVVRRPQPADMVDQLAVLVQFEGATMTDVYTARRAIEPMIAENAAMNASAEHIEELERLMSRLSATEDSDYEQYQADSLRFNNVMSEASGLVLLGYFLDALSQVMNTWIMPKLPFDEERRERLWSVHREVLEAIHDRDPMGARRASIEARTRSEAYWQERLPQVANAPIERFDAGWLDPSALLPTAARSGHQAAAD